VIAGGRPSFQALQLRIGPPVVPRPFEEPPPSALAYLIFDLSPEKGPRPGARPPRAPPARPRSPASCLQHGMLRGLINQHAQVLNRIAAAVTVGWRRRSHPTLGGKLRTATTRSAHMRRPLEAQTQTEGAVSRETMQAKTASPITTASGARYMVRRAPHRCVRKHGTRHRDSRIPMHIRRRQHVVKLRE
jgi:hypothetical protein